MAEQPDKPSIHSVEADLFGSLFGFHKRLIALLRRTSLDDEKLKVAADQINVLLDAVTDEVKRTPQLDMTQRLEAVYGEVESLVHQLSGHSAGEGNGGGEAADGAEEQ